MSIPLIVRPRAYGPKRPMLLFISDIHLTDDLGTPAVPWDQTFERFWTRIEAARGELPAQLCIIGDFIDIVRSTTWLEGEHRPYHDPNPAMIAVVDSIVGRVLKREEEFFAAIRSRVEEGSLEMTYVLGNHDRLMAHAPKARRALWKAMTGQDREIEFADQHVFSSHGALAYHGHFGDFICSSREGRAPLSDIFGLELIVRFPNALRARIEGDIPHLDDIDDVRPIYAVPSWIRQISGGDKTLMRPVGDTWTALVEEFLDNNHFQEWMRDQPTVAGISPARRIQTLLNLSRTKVMARASDKRLTRMFKTLQHVFDGQFAQRAAHKLGKPKYKGLRYVLNGHSHFPSMTPLGHIEGKPAVYFNSGTWRTVHQIGTHASGRPTFLPYHAMTYIAFFPDGDRMGRDYEWWTGAMVARR